MPTWADVDELAGRLPGAEGTVAPRGRPPGAPDGIRSLG